MFISKKHVSRRAVLKGLGATVALPLLDAMVPARTVFAKTAAGASAAKQRLVCMEMVHGNAASTAIGVKKNLFAPAQVGRDFDWSPTLEPLAPFREYLTILTNTDVHNPEPFTLPQLPGDHPPPHALSPTHHPPNHPY